MGFPAQPLSAVPEVPATPLSVDHVPAAPRAATARARRLVFHYAGSQKAGLIVGIAFLLFGVPFSVAFGWGTVEDVRVAVNGVETEGTVVSVEEVTNVTVNDEHPWRIVFSYAGADGKPLQASSTTLNSHLVSGLAAGSKVPVEVAGEHARVAGTSIATFGYFGLLAVIFPLLGALMTFFTIRSNRREIAAFTHGVPVAARVTHAGYDLSTEINGRHPFRVAWEFSVDAGVFTGSLTSMNPDQLQEYAEPPEVVVLYLPEDPRINTLYVE